MLPAVDVNTLKQLMAEKLPQREIAKRLNVPRTTLQRMIKGLNEAPAAEVAVAVPSDGVPIVDMSTLTPAEVEAVRGDLGSEYEWNGKLGSFGSRALRRHSETDIFARLNLRNLLRLNADSHDSSDIDTDVCPHVG